MKLTDRAGPLRQRAKNVSVYWDTHSRNFVDLKERLMAERYTSEH